MQLQQKSKILLPEMQQKMPKIKPPSTRPSPLTPHHPPFIIKNKQKLSRPHAIPH
jgi:hypothetical protein